MANIGMRFALGCEGGSNHPNSTNSGTAMFKKIIFCFAALAAVSLTACNTIQGAGKDVERGGQKVQEESKEVQKKM
jgi:predicted small secreted protein